MAYGLTLPVQKVWQGSCWCRRHPVTAAGLVKLLFDRIKLHCFRAIGTSSPRLTPAIVPLPLICGMCGCMHAGKRPSSATALSSYASQDSLDAATTGADSSNPAGSKQLPPAAAAAAAGDGNTAGTPGSVTAASSLANSRPGSSSSLSKPPAPPSAVAATGSGGSSGSSHAVGAARSAAAVPSAGGAPNTGQATTISLQWLTRPRTVLVMRKLAPTTEAAFLRALDWLRYACCYGCVGACVCTCVCSRVGARIRVYRGCTLLCPASGIIGYLAHAV